jgi:hypothetical protein
MFLGYIVVVLVWLVFIARTSDVWVIRRVALLREAVQIDENCGCPMVDDHAFAGITLEKPFEPQHLSEDVPSIISATKLCQIPVGSLGQPVASLVVPAYGLDDELHPLLFDIVPPLSFAGGGQAFGEPIPSVPIATGSPTPIVPPGSFTLGGNNNTWGGITLTPGGGGGSSGGGTGGGGGHVVIDNPGPLTGPHHPIDMIRPTINLPPPSQPGPIDPGTNGGSVTIVTPEPATWGPVAIALGAGLVWSMISLRKRGKGQVQSVGF